MLNFAINNEATQGGIPVPLLTNNPYIEDMSIMTELTLQKKCSKCKLKKSLAEFSRSKHTKDGLKFWCKECDHQHYQDNKDDIAIRSKTYYQCNKIKIIEHQKEYYQKYKERIITYQMVYYEANKSEITEKKKAYDQTNKEKIAERRKQYIQTPGGKALNKIRCQRYDQTLKGKATNKKKAHKRRALKADVEYENFNPIEVFDRDRYRCQLCGKKTRPNYSRWHPLYPNLDHIIPLSKGGAHTKKNTQCLCQRCNLVKGNVGIGNQFRLFG